MINQLNNKLRYSFRTRKPVTLNALECQELLEVIERNKKAMKFLLEHALNFNGEKATAVAHSIATHSTYAPNQVISFSSQPRLMTIKGDTLKEQYKSMYTGDCSNTDLAKVLDLLKGLDKFPKFIIVMSDMEFDQGSRTSRKELYELFKQNEVDTKLIWWNFNNRSRTVPEIDEYGNYYLSGYNLQILKLLENNIDMTTYIDKILDKYKKDIANR